MSIILILELMILYLLQQGRSLIQKESCSNIHSLGMFRTVYALLNQRFVIKDKQMKGAAHVMMMPLLFVSCFQ